MADISKVVDYDALHELEIMKPDEDPAGITMMIRSAESDAVKKILRHHNDSNIENYVKGKRVKSITYERQELERAAACIASWDWGDNTWKGEVPELSMKKAIEILDAQGWIFAQVSEASKKVSNFLRDSVNASGSE